MPPEQSLYVTLIQARRAEVPAPWGKVDIKIDFVFPRRLHSVCSYPLPVSLVDSGFNNAAMGDVLEGIPKAARENTQATLILPGRPLTLVWMFQICSVAGFGDHRGKPSVNFGWYVRKLCSLMRGRNWEGEERLQELGSGKEERIQSDLRRHGFELPAVGKID